MRGFHGLVDSRLTHRPSGEPLASSTVSVDATDGGTSATGRSIDVRGRSRTPRGGQRLAPQRSRPRSENLRVPPERRRVNGSHPRVAQCRCARFWHSCGTPAAKYSQRRGRKPAPLLRGAARIELRSGCARSSLLSRMNRPALRKARMAARVEPAVLPCASRSAGSRRARSLNPGGARPSSIERTNGSDSPPWPSNPSLLRGAARIRTGDKGFAVLCLTTWPRRHIQRAGNCCSDL